MSAWNLREWGLYLSRHDVDARMRYWKERGVMAYAIEDAFPPEFTALLVADGFQGPTSYYVVVAYGPKGAPMPPEPAEPRRKADPVAIFVTVAVVGVCAIVLAGAWRKNRQQRQEVTLCRAAMAGRPAREQLAILSADRACVAALDTTAIGQPAGRRAAR